MARNYMFIRQEAEALVDLLEANATFQLHDRTALDMATELREMFGMCTRERSLQIQAEMDAAGPGTKIELNVTCYEAPDFSKINITPQ